MQKKEKDFGFYHKMLKTSFEEVYRVLKHGSWLTVTFHNTSIRIYNSIIKAVVLAGFDLEKIVYQPPAKRGAKQQLQPYGSAVGDYYIRFQKTKSPLRCHYCGSGTSGLSCGKKFGRGRC